jgi:hypothetical protein
LFESLLNRHKPVIDLIIPGLFDLPLYELDEAALQQQTPALHRLLRFALRQQNSHFDIDDILADGLGLNQSALPYAQAFNADIAGQGVLVKPVYLKADINNALVFPVTESEENLNKLINDLADYFKVDFDLTALPENLYLMRLHQVQPVHEVPHYLSAMGKKVTHYLEQAKHNLEWFRLFNEIQMFLYQHPVNQQRQQQGEAMINSLWCWGAEHWPEQARDNHQWFSDNCEMQALGRLFCGSCYTLDELSRLDPRMSATLVDLSLIHSLKGDSNQPLDRLLNEIEHKYLNRLLDIDTHQICLKSGASFNLLYQQSMQRKFWKKTPKLSQFID